MRSELTLIALATALGALCGTAISTAGKAAQLLNAWGTHDFVQSVQLSVLQLIGEGYYRRLFISAATWWGPLYLVNAALIVAIAWSMGRLADSRLRIIGACHEQAGWKLRAAVVCPECGTTNNDRGSNAGGTTARGGLIPRVLLICLTLALLAGFGTAWFWQLYHNSSAGVAGMLWDWWNGIVWPLVATADGWEPPLFHSPRYWVGDGLTAHLPFMVLHGVVLSGMLWLIGAFRVGDHAALECTQCGYDLRGHVTGDVGQPIR